MVANRCSGEATTTISSSPRSSTCSSVLLGGGATVMSAPPARSTSSIRSALVYSFRSSSTSGNRRRQLRITGTRSQPVIVSAQAIRTRPPVPAATRLAAVTALSAAASAIRASPTTATPAAVGRTPRGTRSMTATPSWRSMAAIWCESAGWDMCSTVAAFVIEPCSTIVTRHSSPLSEIIGNPGPPARKSATSASQLCS
jgi:hypothetical protein